MITKEQFNSAKILIVDDEPAMIELLENTLQRKGYACIKSVTDSRETLDIYQEFHPDLVLLDLNMPHLSGLQVLKQLCDLDQKRHVPIMILTAQTDNDPRLEALKLGARDFLGKPFDLIELSIRVRNLLEVRFLINQLYLNCNDLEKQIKGKSFELAVAMTKLNKHDETMEKNPADAP